MTREHAQTWLENRGYKVVYQMGSYPYEGYYMAQPRGPWGQILRGKLNGIVKQVKSLRHDWKKTCTTSSLQPRTESVTDNNHYSTKNICQS